MTKKGLMISDIELQAYSRRLEIIKLTAAQIQKDFDMAGYEIMFSGNEADAYNELFNQIMPVVKNLVESDYEKLMQLLYRIDVSESKIKNESALHDEPFHDLLTRLIIYRELQKVVTRIYFKEKS